MTYRYFLAMLMLIFSITSYSENLTPQAEIRQTTQDIIALLEQGKYGVLVDNYVDIPSDQKAKARQWLTTESSARNQKMGKLLNILKMLKDKEPVFSYNKTIATFEFTIDDTVKEMEFRKINGKWLLAN